MLQRGLNSGFPWVSLLTLLILFVFIPGPAHGKETQQDAPARTVSEISKATLEKKVDAIEADNSMSKEDRLKLVDLYRKAISNLETAVFNEQAAEDFIRQKQDAPEETAKLLKRTPQTKTKISEESLGIKPSVAVDELEQRLLKEQADLAAVEAKLQKTEETAKYLADRPKAIRNLLIEAKKAASGISEELKEPASGTGSSPLEEAAYALKYSEARRLATQIRALDQELLSLPERSDLLKAEETYGQFNAESIRARVAILEKAINERRQIQARLTESKAESAKALAAGKHPLVAQLADRNAALSAQISELTSKLNLVTKEEARISAEGQHLANDFKNTRQKLEIAGLSQILGQILQEQRRGLPDIRTYARKNRQIETQIAEISLSKMQHSEELKSLYQMDEFLANYTKDIKPETAQQIDAELRTLAEDRKQFLEQAYEAENAYLQALSELDIAQRNLIEVTRQYDDFLSEHLLWIRSIPPIRPSSITQLPGQLQELLAPDRWHDIISTLYTQARTEPWIALTLIAFTILMWTDKALRARLIATGDPVGNVIRDNIIYTAWGLVLTVLRAFAWPLLLAGTGWQLAASLDAGTFTKTVGQGMVQIAQFLLILRAYRILCMKGGVADRHFKWPQTSLRRLRHAIDIFTYTFLPAGFIAYIVIFSDIPGHDDGLGRVAFVIAAIALTAFFYRVLNPTTGALREFSLRQKKPAAIGIRYLWLVLAVITPLSAAVLALLGYLYSSSKLMENLIQSLLLILELVLLHQFVTRWLLIARRRLALQAARAERQAKLAARQVSTQPPGEDTLDITEPSIDIESLSDDIRKLLNTTLVILAAFALWASWSDILPAFRIFEGVTLWQHKVDIDGQVQVLPITLADIGLTIVIVTVLMIILKRLPALIEILLRQRSSVSPGSIYAIKSLTSYTVIAIAVTLVFGTLGGTWSEIQWVFAALGVGIGFGLQEIVANFISGLIILFERPIRVGDVVTVGEVSGTVTKIRIRATTIRDFDRRELLVPNKEFITGRLLNWSLSDTITRLSVPVGIAYGSDVELATHLMEEAARESVYTINEPAPYVSFDAFGNDALVLILLYFIDNMDYRIISKSELHTAINRKFTEAGITIAFPQRDVHLDTSQPLDIRIQRDTHPAAGEAPA
jgi:potassium efflux system protein